MISQARLIELSRAPFGVSQHEISEMAKELLASRQCIPLPIGCVVNGRQWNIFAVEFSSDNSLYSFYLHALNKEHASYRLEDIKASAVLADGQIIGAGRLG